MPLKTDYVINATSVGKMFTDYEELKQAFIQGDSWIQTLVQEYSTIEVELKKALYEKMKKAENNLKEEEEKCLGELHLNSKSRNNTWENRHELKTQYQKKRCQLCEQHKNMFKSLHTQVVAQMGRPSSPVPEEVLPNYDLMDND